MRSKMIKMIKRDYKLTSLTNNLKISGEQDKILELLLLFDRCRKSYQGYNWVST